MTAFPTEASGVGEPPQGAALRKALLSALQNQIILHIWDAPEKFKFNCHVFFPKTALGKLTYPTTDYKLLSERVFEILVSPSP
jgi:hypothetical protein